MFQHQLLWTTAHFMTCMWSIYKSWCWNKCVSLSVATGFFVVFAASDGHSNPLLPNRLVDGYCSILRLTDSHRRLHRGREMFVPFHHSKGTRWVMGLLVSVLAISQSRSRGLQVRPCDPLAGLITRQLAEFPLGMCGWCHHGITPEPALEALHGTLCGTSVVDLYHSSWRALIWALTQALHEDTELWS